MRGGGWFWRHYLHCLDGRVRVYMRRGKWGLFLNADYWCGELQVRLGWLLLHLAVAEFDAAAWSSCSRSIYWSGVRLYVGRGRRMRLVDAWERRVPVADMWPHLSYTGVMEGA